MRTLYGIPLFNLSSSATTFPRLSVCNVMAHAYRFLNSEGKVYCSLSLYSRNPNKPRPVQMFWPSYTKDAQQYLHISRDMTSDSVRSHIFTRELNFWKKVVPAVKRAVDDLRKDDQSATVTKGSGYCEKDGGCEP